MGIGQNESKLYMIDFGLAKKYRSSKTLQHIQYTTNKKLTGTARYASVNALRGSAQSRRDDLEAIGYVLLYFLRGSLPWQGLKLDRKDDRYRKIYEKKKNTTPKELCKDYPQEFEDYLTYCRNLEFEQDPDYEYLKSLFYKVLQTIKFGFNLVYDWTDKSKATTQRHDVIKIDVADNEDNECNCNFLNDEIPMRYSVMLSGSRVNPKFLENLNLTSPLPYTINTADYSMMLSPLESSGLKSS
jgi:serine/threonine protein kinase